MPVLALAAITLTDWQSGLILLVLLPLVPLFMILIGLMTNRLVLRRYVALGRLSGQFLDLLRGLTTLRIYGQAGAQERTLRRATEDFRNQTMATLRIAFLSGLVLDLIAALSVAVVAVDIGLRLDAGHVSLRIGLLVLLLAPEVFAPLRAVGTQHHASQEGGAAAAAVLDLVDEVPAAARVGAGVTAAPASGRVVLDQVSVSYPARTLRALDTVSLAFGPGRVTALTGASGAGKSTLLAVLLGFVAPVDGSVSVGVGDAGALMALDQLDVDLWRRSVAWLPQRPRPSQPTIAAEVRLGDVDASADELADACRICRTPDPSTRLGEDGRSVSAGQRRRIALARVLLRARAVARSGGVPLILLDEPGEDLDPDTARVVAAVIEELSGWATVVLASHSPAIVELADRRIEFAGGHVVEVIDQLPVCQGSSAAAVVEVARDVPTPAPATAENPFGLRELIRGSAAGHRLLLAGTLSILASLAGLGLTGSSLWLISRAAQHPNVQALAIAVVGVRTFAIGRAVLRYCERLVTHDAALLMLTGLRVRVFAALRPLSPAVLGGYGRGDLLRRFVGDVDGAQEGLVRAVVPTAGAAAGALAAVALAAAMSPAAGGALALGLLIAGIAAPAAGFRSAGGAGPAVALVGERDRASAGLVESLSEVVAYGGADRALDDIEAIDVVLEQAVRRPSRAAGVGTFVGGAAAAVSLATVLALATRDVSAGGLSFVDVGVLIACVLAGFDSVATLPNAFVAWARCKAGLQRVLEVTSQQPALPDPMSPGSTPAGPFGLRGAGMTLAAGIGAPIVLRRADLAVRSGERVAVVGPSGCGKSTLLTAVLRLLPLGDGTLELTGTDRSIRLCDTRAGDLPPLVAGSLQGDHVFDSTLRDNLRVVRPAASDADLDELADRVGLLGTIRALPAGWSTPAGPDGAAISGGQRQRLLVARALLADPAILILDEPTAHLDAATEQLVLADLLDATHGRTVLMTTHRPIADGYGLDVLRLTEQSLEVQPRTSGPGASIFAEIRSTSR